MNQETQNAIRTETTAPTQTRPQTPIGWYRPAVDVLEGADGLKLVIDLPGVPSDRIDVKTEGRTLTVQGVRDDRGGNRRFGWRRVFTLPPTVDGGAIEARSENGVLTLTLPTAEAAKPRRIEVR